MRIRFIAKNIPVPGKAGNPVVLDIAARLQDREHTIDLIYPKEWVPWVLRRHPKYRHLYGLGPWSSQGLFVRPWTYPRLPFPAHAYRLLGTYALPGWKRQDAYDLLHAHYLLPDGWLGVRLGQETGRPVVVTARSTDVKLLRKSGPESHTWRLARQVLSRVDTLLTLNGPVRDFFSRHFGVAAEILPHGISEDLIGPDIPAPKDIDVLTVGSAIPRKQVDWVIRAFREAPQADDKRLVVVGEGPSLVDWKKIAAGDSRIQFAGRLPHHAVMALMQRSKIFALPSYQETFGLVYLEAAAAGNALIGRAGEGVSGVFQPTDGMDFPVDYPGFRRVLHELFARPPWRAERARAAWQRVRQLTWPVITDQYETLYRGIVDSTNPVSRK